MDLAALLSAPGLDGVTTAVLVAVSFGTSFIAVTFGLGGGILLLAIMANLMPTAALIPVHGAIQLGSNAFRAGLLRRFIAIAPIPAFAAGAAIGALLGGLVAVELKPALIRAAVGLFVLWTVFARPPIWVGRVPWLTGAISSILTMFVGATGPFVATLGKSLGFERQTFVATHAALMTLQHGLKLVVFGALGFAFSPWIGFIAAMILSGAAGTWAGSHILSRMSDGRFRVLLNGVLILVSIRLLLQALGIQLPL